MFDDGPMMRNGIEALVGEEGVVSLDIPGTVHLGAVHARGEDWPAISAYGEPIAKGAIVYIIEVDKGHLIVSPQT
jgi:membrane-bound ClpP family serine protease